MAAEVEQYFNFALEVVKEGGEVINDAIKKKKNIQTKSCDVDFVTETDQAVEKLIISKISAAFPSHKFIGEESTAAGKAVVLTEDPTWIIDPIDGTMNFVHTNPNSCISLGLAVNKELEAGIIYNPMLKLMFTAMKGKGAYLNGDRIHVSGETDLSKALMMTELGTSRDPDKMKCVSTNMNNMLQRMHGLRSWGSAAMDMVAVAAGWVDLYFEFGIHCWDMAAGVVIVREAGGVVVDTEGGELDLMARRLIAAATPEIAATLAKELYQYSPPRD